MVGNGTLEQVLDALEGRRKQAPYCVGDCFTAVDVCLGRQIGGACSLAQSKAGRSSRNISTASWAALPAPAPPKRITP